MTNLLVDIVTEPRRYLERKRLTPIVRDAAILFLDIYLERDCIIDHVTDSLRITKPSENKQNGHINQSGELVLPVNIGSGKLRPNDYAVIGEETAHAIHNSINPFFNKRLNSIFDDYRSSTDDDTKMTLWRDFNWLKNYMEFIGAMGQYTFTADLEDKGIVPEGSTKRLLDQHSRVMSCATDLKLSPDHARGYYFAQKIFEKRDEIDCNMLNLMLLDQAGLEGFFQQTIDRSDYLDFSRKNFDIILSL